MNRTSRSLFLREMVVWRRDWLSFLIRTLIQPALFLLVFGVLIPSLTSGFSGGRAGVEDQMLLVMGPGLVANAAFAQSMLCAAMPLMMELSYTREIESRTGLPVGPMTLASVKVTAAAVQGFVAAACVDLLFAVFAWEFSVDLPLGWIGVIPIWIASFPVCLCGSACGLLLGSIINAKSLGSVFSALMLPISMLGCVYFPWSLISGRSLWRIVVLFNLQTYASEFVRHWFRFGDGLDPGFCFMVIFLLGILLGLLGFRSFKARL